MNSIHVALTLLLTAVTRLGQGQVNFGNSVGHSRRSQGDTLTAELIYLTGSNSTQEV